MRFSFRLKIFIGFIISMYVLSRSNDFTVAMALISASKYAGVPGYWYSGWSMIISYFVVAPFFVAFSISILIRMPSFLFSALGLKPDTKKAENITTRKKTKNESEIIDAEWTDVASAENRS